LGHTKPISFSLFLEVLAVSLIFLFSNVEIAVLCFSLTALASTFYHPPALSATSNISPSDFLSRGLGLTEITFRETSFPRLLRLFQFDIGGREYPDNFPESGAWRLIGLVKVLLGIATTAMLAIILFA